MSSQIFNHAQSFRHTQSTDQESLQFTGFTPASIPQQQRHQEETLLHVQDTPAQIDIGLFIQNQNEERAKLWNEFKMIRDNQAGSRYRNAAVIGFIIGLTIFQFCRFINQSTQAEVINLNEGVTFILLFTLAAAFFNERKINQQTTMFFESAIFKKQRATQEYSEKRYAQSLESQPSHL